MTEVAGLEERERLIAGQLGKLFIQRRDVKAEQNRYTGVWARKKSKITMTDVISHVRGERSFGHYLLDKDNMCRVFALDIDLSKAPCQYPLVDPVTGGTNLHEYIPREAWADRAHPSRTWTKLSLRVISENFARIIVGELGLPCLVSYSGSKGMHVYAFFDQPVPAADAREGAIIVLESSKLFKPKRGKSFYEAIDQDPIEGYPQLDVEAYPKQEKIDSEGYGNLMRIPLGRNFKSERDVSFFVDLTAHGADLRPIDPLLALSSRDPWVMGRTSQTGA